MFCTVLIDKTMYLFKGSLLLGWTLYGKTGASLVFLDCIFAAKTTQGRSNDSLRSK